MEAPYPNTFCNQSTTLVNQLKHIIIGIPLINKLCWSRLPNASLSLQQMRIMLIADDSQLLDK